MCLLCFNDGLIRIKDGGLAEVHDIDLELLMNILFNQVKHVYFLKRKALVILFHHRKTKLLH